MIRASLALALVMASAAAAAAEPTAAEHFERGRRFYDVKEYDAAIAEFKLAYTINPEPVYLFNLAQAHRLKGDCAGAEEFFTKFLKADPKSTARAKIDKLIAECKPSETDLVKPEPDPVGTGTGAAVAPPIPLGPPPPPPDPGRTKRVAGVITFAAGGALLLVGGGLALKVRNTASELEDECAVMCDWSTVRGRDASARTQSTISTVAFVAGGVAIAAGTALYLWGRMKPARDWSRIGVVPTSGGAMVVGGVEF